MNVDDRFEIVATKADGTSRLWTRSTLHVARIIAGKAMDQLLFTETVVTDRLNGSQERRTA